MMILLDSSALLAFLWAEPGAARVGDALSGGEAACAVVNWAEVATKVMARSLSWADAEAALIGLGLTIVPVEPEDAVASARLWRSHPTLSLGDRLCLAVGLRLAIPVVTADAAWAEVSPLVQLVRARPARDKTPS